MILNFTRNASKIFAGCIAISAMSFSTPAKAVVFGNTNELAALDMSYETCMGRAYTAVSTVATSNLQRNGQGFSGNFDSNISISIYCVQAKQGSAVSISTTFVRPAPKDEIFDRLKSIFYR